LQRPLTIPEVHNAQSAGHQIETIIRKRQIIGVCLPKLDRAGSSVFFPGNGQHA